MTVLSLAGFVGVRAALQSYFIEMSEAEQRQKVLGQPAEQLERLRRSEDERLARGAMPIEQAMAAIAATGRPALIAPQPSTDLAPLQGWSQRPAGLSFSSTGAAQPSVAPQPAPAAAAAGITGGPTAAVAGDGGVAMADGAVVPAPTGVDAGAPQSVQGLPPSRPEPGMAPAQPGPGSQATPPAHEGAAHPAH
jgi:hypothetical protein